MSEHTPHLAATCPVCGTTGYEARDPCPLHAAAPALLAALEEACHWLEGRPVGVHPSLIAWYNQARDAIAQA